MRKGDGEDVSASSSSSSESEGEDEVEGEGQIDPTSMEETRKAEAELAYTLA